MVAELLVEPTAPFAALGDAVAGLRDEPLDRLSSDTLRLDIVTLRRHIDQLEAECCRRLRRYEETRHGDAMAATPMALLRAECRMSSAEAMHRVQVAEHLPALPGAVEAFAEGDITLRHASLLARCVDRLGTETVQPVAADLVDAARRLYAEQLGTVIAHLRHCVDPDGALDDARHAHERRWLHLSPTLDGVVVIDGVLDAEGGALLRTAVETLAAPLPGESRSASQRRADALVELARRQLQQGDLPSSSGVRPHIVITTAESTLRAQPGAPAADSGWVGTMVAQAVRRLACDASVLRMIVDDDGAPLSVGRTSRTVPPSLRRAVDLRDRGCRFPGCDRPPEWTDAHHVRHWADGGETSAENLVLLCRPHHRAVHEGGWQLRVAPGGALETIPP